jgi:cholesterol transport system auxiliary component
VRHSTKVCLRLFAIVSVLLLIAGCMGRRPSPFIEQYALEYPPPRIEGIDRLDVAILVERFSVAQVFNSTDMVYRPTVFKRDAYAYHRWRANPADLVTDYLVRDLQDSGLFWSVFGYREAGQARFRLEGGVEEFLDSGEKAGRKAVLVLQVTLLDTTESDVTRRVIFQRKYCQEETVSQEGPQGFVGAMSAAMKKVSRDILRDVYMSLREHMK